MVGKYHDFSKAPNTITLKSLDMSKESARNGWPPDKCVPPKVSNINLQAKLLRQPPRFPEDDAAWVARLLAAEQREKRHRDALICLIIAIGTALVIAGILGL